MRETWYVLEDDTAADPNEVAPDDAGVLRHKGGLAVAIGPNGPRSRGVDVGGAKAEKPEDPAKAKTEVARVKVAKTAADRQMSAGAGGSYQTR